jgi:hypothetical protein
MALFDALRFKIGADLSDFESGMRKVDDIAGKSAQTLGNAFKAVGTIAAGVFGTAGLVTKSVVETSAQMETLEARLSSLLGSATAGKERLNELIQIGATSPFDVTQLAEATATLEAFTGQSSELLGPVQDLAAFMNVDLNEAAQSLGRAFAGGAGAADVLRERGILRMVELREGIKATDMSVEELQAALVGLMTDETGQIAGGADRLAGTWAGMVSNMQDQWVQLQHKIGQTGLFDGLQRAGRELLTIWDENSEKVNALANEIGTGLMAGIATVIQGAGALYDGWTQFQIAVKSSEGIVVGLDALWQEFVGDTLVGLSEIADELALMARLTGQFGLANLIEESQESLASFGLMAQANADASAAKMRTIREEVDELKQSLGEGAAFAERLNSALLDGGGSQGTGTSFGTTTPAAEESPLVAEAKDTEDELAKIQEQAAKARAEREKQAAAERLAIAKQEAREREAIARTATSSLQSLVAEGQQIWLDSEVSTSEKVLAMSLKTFSELLFQLSAYLYAKGAANIAAQNYALGAAQIAGGTIAAGAAGALDAEANSIAAGEGSTVADTSSSTSPGRGTSVAQDDAVAADLSRAADALESAAESLERAAGDLSRVSGGGGGGTFSIRDDVRGDGPLRRFVRNATSRTGRAGFRGA